MLTNGFALFKQLQAAWIMADIRANTGSIVTGGQTISNIII